MGFSGADLPPRAESREVGFSGADLPPPVNWVYIRRLFSNSWGVNMREGGINPNSVEARWEPAREFSALPAEKLWNVVAAFAITQGATGLPEQRDYAKRTAEIVVSADPGSQSFVRIEVQDNGFGSRIVVTFGVRAIGPEALNLAARQSQVPQNQPPQDVCQLAKDIVNAAEEEANEPAAPARPEPEGITL